MCNADGCRLMAYGGFWDIYTMFPVLAFPANTQFTTLPSSALRPRPEPKISDEEAHTEWAKAYQVWGGLRCPGDCKKGYFCKLHGSWITGQEVADGEAPPVDNQATKDEDCLALHSDGDAIASNFSWVIRYIGSRDAGAAPSDGVPQVEAAAQIAQRTANKAVSLAAVETAEGMCCRSKN